MRVASWEDLRALSHAQEQAEERRHVRGLGWPTLCECQEELAPEVDRRGLVLHLVAVDNYTVVCCADELLGLPTLR